MCRLRYNELMAGTLDIVAGLYLEDSYLLGIVVRGKQLQLHALFALTSDHPAYVKPEQGEQHCYREGEFRWEDVKIISSQGRPRPALSADPDGTLDFGSVGYTLDNGIHHVTADWLDVRFTARQAEAVLA